MGRFIGTVRAHFRLIVFALLTGAFIAVIKVRGLFADECPHFVAGAANVWARVLSRLCGFEYRVRGNRPEPNSLVLANHRSYLDIVALLSQTPCAFLAKEEIGQWPVMGYAARLNNTVFVDRDCKVSRKAARLAAIERLQRGLTFAAFPEGTTRRGPGIDPFYPGLFWVAYNHGYKLVPVAIEYGHPEDCFVDKDEFLPHFLRCFAKRRVLVNMVYGPALSGIDGERMRTFSHQWIQDNLEVPVAESPEGYPETIPDALPA